jgi:hypothetical protein
MSTDWADIALVLGAPDDPLFGSKSQFEIMLRIWVVF